MTYLEWGNGDEERHSYLESPLMWLPHNASQRQAPQLSTTAAVTHSDDFGEDDGEGGLRGAVDERAETADDHVEPLGRVQPEHAQHRHRRYVLFLSGDMIAR